MKKLSTILLLLIFTFISSYAQKLSVDTEKSKIKWIGKEITTSMHYGTLKFIGGEINIQPEAVTGKVIVDMESLSVDDLTGGSKARHEGHLRSDDFFSVSSHKSSTIEVTSSKKNGDNYDVDVHFGQKILLTSFQTNMFLHFSVIFYDLSENEDIIIVFQVYRYI